MRLLQLILLLLIVLISGCGPKITVILLPDDTGATGEVVVKTDEGEVVVDKAYSYSTVARGGVLPSVPADITPETVMMEYGQLIDAQPPSPLSYTLYFRKGSTLLTPESKELLPVVHRSLIQDMPVEISIIGHSDSVGKKEYNARLSLKRANAVKKLLLDFDPALDNITVQSFGENDPLVPTPDNVSEPKNRRVEVMIR